ncbi:MAG: hypothetical protein KOO60_04035 [Gemmatimonadales bacterium]|nr:hypothetical protein [Gemmatimonadales bacterium]
MKRDLPNLRSIRNLNSFRLRTAFFILALIATLAPALILAQIQAGSGNVQPASSPADRENTEPLSAYRVGMRVYESERGRQLLGEVIPADFDHFLPGWSIEQGDYQPVAEDLAVLAAVSEPLEIICVLGTWCSDSEREVPRFWKTLQESDNPNLVLTHFAVGRASDETARSLMVEIGFDESLRDVYNVELVPTFIFFRGDRELGRIVETPVGTLEQDAAEILKAEFSVSGELKNPDWR